MCTHTDRLRLQVRLLPASSLRYAGCGAGQVRGPGQVRGHGPHNGDPEMKCCALMFVMLVAASLTFQAAAQQRLYLTTQSPLTLLSSNDGEYAQLYQQTPDGTTDWELTTKDSFTVIQLGPDHPPIIKTVYDTVAATIHGTPTMAMSSAS